MRKPLILKPIIAFVLLTVFYSCQKIESACLYESSLNEIRELALKLNKDFCLVLIKDSNQIEEYKSRIKSNHTNSQFVFNFINITNPSNHWYQYLIGSNKTPFTFVFKNNSCRNIVFGTSKYAFQSIKNTQENISNSDYFGFYENSILPASKCVNTVIQQLLELTLDSIKGKEQHILNNSMTKIVYPYNLFLKIKSLRTQDSIDYYSYKLLSEFQTPKYNYIYRNIFEEVKDITNMTNTLIITTDKEQYNCNQGDSINIYIKAKNNTPIPIKISRLETSCECLSIVAQLPHIIRPKTSHTYTLNFSSKEIGRHYRELFIYSDAEVPISIIGMNINVKY